MSWTPIGQILVVASRLQTAKLPEGFLVKENARTMERFRMVGCCVLDGQS